MGNWLQRSENRRKMINETEELVNLIEEGTLKEQLKRELSNLKSEQARYHS